MKSLPAGCLVAAVLVAVAMARDNRVNQPPPFPEGNTPGRFAVVTGGQLNQRDLTIRVDTATGQTWQLIELSVSGRRETVAGWVPIFEDPLEAVEALERARKPVKNPIVPPFEYSVTNLFR